MATAWNKGKTKETNPSVAKISATMKARGLDNFLTWRNRMKDEGKIKSNYPPFAKDERFAELIGVTLGDGHIESLPRTDRLIISGDANKPAFINRYAELVRVLFQKEPHILFSKTSNAVRISIYEKNICQRLGIPSGNRHDLCYKIPDWIDNNRCFLTAFLRGLYEAEGFYGVHKPTYTYKLNFYNYNQSLLDLVFASVSKLGFHPHRSRHAIQLSRKDEVESLRSIIRFRQ